MEKNVKKFASLTFGEAVVRLIFADQNYEKTNAVVIQDVFRHRRSDVSRKQLQNKGQSYSSD
jgi:hypothetical protein